MNSNKHTIILGGGLAGLSLAHFLKDETIILEKEDKLGGLCRSFDFENIKHDIGPHIIFSKDKKCFEMLKELTVTNNLRRSNKILHKNKFVKYPFENQLSALDDNERDYCLTEFLNNPYENYEADNMLQFFLKTFGEGITNLYLQPYNEKIWKFNPAYMDTQMVERIPKPPREDVIKAAKGIETEGYTHQLYFHYPTEGGIQSLIDSYQKLISTKTKIVNPVTIKTIDKENDLWKIDTDKGSFSTSQLINCMPLHELFKYLDAPATVSSALDCLNFNSIYTVLIRAKRDKLEDNFAIFSADKNIIFHRLSKLNFFGDNYCQSNNETTILAEITYRPDSYYDSLDSETIKNRVIEDLDSLNLVNKNDIISTSLKDFKYAYVIYDLYHKKNTNTVLNYLKDIGVTCCGRFAEFEYLNMDHVIKNSNLLASKLNEIL